MAKTAGRKVRIKSGGTAIAGALTDALTINREHIEITDKDDAGIRTFLDEIGTFSMSMTCSGRLDGLTLLNIAEDSTDVLNSFVFDIDSVGTFTGNFGITTFEIGGEDGANAATFSATFESSGVIVWAATP
jgi:predicted secreted protein